MKTYKENKIYIGSSDIASLVVSTPDDVRYLHFGEDGEYYAWYVDDPEVEIPDHYRLMVVAESWLKIYDDNELVFNERGIFEVYRAGEMGCLIRKVS